MKNQFIVWSPQGEKPPTCVYNYRWQADKEAKRLSVEHPNQLFNVCKIKSTAINSETEYFGKWRPNKSRSQKVESIFADQALRPLDLMRAPF